VTFARSTGAASVWPWTAAAPAGVKTARHRRWVDNDPVPPPNYRRGSAWHLWEDRAKPAASLARAACVANPERGQMNAFDAVVRTAMVGISIAITGSVAQEAKLTKLDTLTIQ